MATSDKGSQRMKSLVIKFPPDLIVRLDKYVNKIRESHLGVQYSRADVIRRFIARGLDEFEEGNELP